MDSYDIHDFEEEEVKPPVGAKPGWLAASERISVLAGAILRYSTVEHGTTRRFPIRMWATEILMQCDIWDRITELQEDIYEEEL